MRDTQAAKDVLYRRVRCHHNLDSANKTLDKARAKNKGLAEVFISGFRLSLDLKIEENVDIDFILCLNSSLSNGIESLLCYFPLKYPIINWL